MGYNCKVKGVDLTFEVFKKIREKYDALLYVVVASHKEELEEEIKKHFGQKPDWLTVLPPSENIGAYYRSTPQDGEISWPSQSRRTHDFLKLFHFAQGSSPM